MTTMTTLVHTHDRVQLACKVSYVVPVQSCHRNPPIPRQINVRLFYQRLALCRLEASEAVII